MKTLIHKIYTSPRYTRTLQWGKLITVTGSLQVVIQGIGFICGILIIRLLPTQEYALYTLVNTMLGTIIVLADGDVARSVMALGGKVWQDRKKLGTVISTGFDLRSKFAFVSLILAVPVLLYLLLHHGASWLMAILIILSIIPSFLAALSGTLLEIAPKLYQDIAPLQRIQVQSSLVRLFLLGLSLFFFPLAIIAVLAAGFPQIWANIKLRRLSLMYADWRQCIDITVRKKILAMVKRLLPGAIYYCLSGQITIWIVSFFGSTTALAQIGALGRLSMVMNIFNILFLTLIVPRFARMPPIVGLLFKRFIQVQFGALVLSVLIISIIWVFSTDVLLILGKNYSGLNTEVVLSVTGSCISLVAGAAFTLSISRGWAINPLIYIPVSIVSIICGAFLIDISTLKGVLLLNIFIAVVQLGMYFFYSLNKILRCN